MKKENQIKIYTIRDMQMVANLHAMDHWIKNNRARGDAPFDEETIKAVDKWLEDLEAEYGTIVKREFLTNSFGILIYCMDDKEKENKM